MGRFSKPFRREYEGRFGKPFRGGGVATFVQQFVVNDQTPVVVMDFTNQKFWAGGSSTLAALLEQAGGAGAISYQDGFLQVAHALVSYLGAALTAFRGDEVTVAYGYKMPLYAADGFTSTGVRDLILDIKPTGLDRLTIRAAEGGGPPRDGFPIMEIGDGTANSYYENGTKVLAQNEYTSAASRWSRSTANSGHAVAGTLTSATARTAAFPTINTIYTRADGAGRAISLSHMVIFASAMSDADLVTLSQKLPRGATVESGTFVPGVIE